jgi:glycosyltransferase involved in cell wall biosynthesis
MDHTINRVRAITPRTRSAVLFNALATRAGGALNRVGQVAQRAAAAWGTEVYVVHHPWVPIAMPQTGRVKLPWRLGKLPPPSQRILEGPILRNVVQRLSARAVLHYGIYVPTPLPAAVANILYLTNLAPWTAGPDSHRLRNKSRRAFFEHTRHWATSIIVQSLAARDIVLGFYPDLRGKIHAVRNGCALPALHRSGVARGFVMVGDVHRYRRIHEVIMAYAALPPEVRAHHPLIIVGSENYDPEGSRLMRAAIGQTAGFANVILVGSKPREEVLQLLVGARAFISFAEIENGPNSLVEALGLGITPILSDLPVHREFAGDVGMYVNDIDGLTRAMLASSRQPSPSAGWTNAIDTWDIHLHELGQVLANLDVLDASRVVNTRS